MPETLAAPRATRHGRPRSPIMRELLSVAELCEQCNISRTLFYELRQKGVGPKATRIGRRLLISREHAAAWIRSLEERAA